MRRILAILNNKARKGRREGAIDAAKEALRAIGADVVVTDGQGIGPAARRGLEEGYDVIAGGGGDGTLNTVSSAVAGTETSFGIVPMGTLNHLAIELGIPFEPEGAADVLRNGETRRIDIGSVNELRFINNSSVGIYPWLVRTRARLEGKGYGKWQAFAAAISALAFGMPVVTVRMKVGGRIIEKQTPFVFVGNNKYEMESLDAWRREGFDAGILTVCVLHDRSRWAFVKLLFAAMRGRLKESDEFDVIGLAELEIDAPGRRIDVALDGEVKSMDTPLRYKILPRALKIVVPASKNAT